MPRAAAPAARWLLSAPSLGPGAQPAARQPLSAQRPRARHSARSLLLTLLGEYVLPRDAPVWTSVLVGALAKFGVGEKSARQSLARTAVQGWLVAERHGRRVRWDLTATGRRLLVEGAQRIYGFGGAERSWDGAWLVVLVSVPEAKRDLRGRLRSRLSWAGLGSPAPGLWISPHPGREPEALRVLQELGLAGHAMSFTASYGALGSQDTMVARAWDLAGLRGRYERFIAEFGEPHPCAAKPVLCAQARLVHEWRRFPFVDPQLPPELLPADWSGARAAELFRRRHSEWSAAAQREWDDLVSESG